MFQKDQTDRNRRRLAIRTLIALLLLVIAFAVFANVLAWRHAHALMHFTGGNGYKPKLETVRPEDKLGLLFSGVEMPRPAGSQTAADLAPGCVDVQISEADGITLGAWYCSRGTNSPLVILFHGYTDDKTSQIPEAKRFLKMGASVLLVDFRGSGDSSEDYTTIGYREADDVAAAMKYAQEHFEHRKIILYGHSMGAAAILRAVSAYGIAPDGIIATAVFDTMLNTVRNRFHMLNTPAFPGAEMLVFWGGVQVGFNGFEHNPVDYAKAVKCPILFMHGTDDPKALLSEGQHVFDAIPSQKMFKAFPSIGHQPYAEACPAEWDQAVRDLLKAADAIKR